MSKLSYWTVENWMELAMLAKQKYDALPPQTREERVCFLHQIAVMARDRGFSLRVSGRHRGMHGLIRAIAPDDQDLLRETYGSSEKWITQRVHTKVAERKDPCQNV